MMTLLMLTNEFCLLRKHVIVEGLVGVLMGCSYASSLAYKIGLLTVCTIGLVESCCCLLRKKG